MHPISSVHGNVDLKARRTGKRMTRILKIAFLCLVLRVVTTCGAQAVKIRQIDFKNFTYAWDNPINGVPGSWHWITSSPQSRIKANKGIHRFYKRGQDQFEREHAPLLSVDSVTYGDLLGDGNEVAIVWLNYSTGGTANWDYLYIFALQMGSPTLVARLETGSRAFGGLIKASVQNEFLVVDFADEDKRVGDCCSEGYIRVRYRWHKGRFVEVGTREHGDLELHEGSPVSQMFK